MLLQSMIMLCLKCGNILGVSLEDAYEDEFYEPYSIPKHYVHVDDLPVLDERIPRDAEQEITNITTRSPFKDDSGQEWIEEAIKDIAYYLRAHKFNEYDRRYEPNGALALRTYHRTFPRPPLRTLHWEVHKFCDESFLVCIKYLWQRVQGADLRRGDDTSVVIQEQHWKADVNKEQITIVNGECEKLKDRDNILADPFQGPLERFQWRTTASYFMCWYTMNEVEHLRHITENCDNFANCLDPENGARNRDYRANDDLPFECATYSFCPDACCMERYIKNPNKCWENPSSNPCYMVAPPNSRDCFVNRSRNADFNSIVQNHWNLSCTCPLPGYRYDSRYGICVDVDECVCGTHSCRTHDGEACINVVGGYKCVCKWGYSWNANTTNCSVNEAVGQIKMKVLKVQANAEQVDPKERSYLRRLFKYLQRILQKSNAHSVLPGGFWFMIVPLLVIYARI